LAGKFAVSGRNIVEHPATLQLRLFGQSKMKIARVIAGHLGLLTFLAVSRASRSFAPKSRQEPADGASEFRNASEAIPVSAGVNSSELNP
jgi:hypothetical protein